MSWCRGQVEGLAAKDQSYDTRKLVYKRAVRALRRQVLQWARMLKEELGKQGEESDPILDDPALAKLLLAHKDLDALPIDDIRVRSPLHPATRVMGSGMCGADM